MYYKVKKTFVREDDRLKSYSRASLQDLKYYKEYLIEVHDKCIQKQLVDDSYEIPIFIADGNKKMANVILGNYTGMFHFFVSEELLEILKNRVTSHFQTKKQVLYTGKKPGNIIY